MKEGPRQQTEDRDSGNQEMRKKLRMLTEAHL
jgi:hypothetical protein